MEEVTESILVSLPTELRAVIEQVCEKLDYFVHGDWMAVWSLSSGCASVNPLIRWHVLVNSER